MKKHFALFAALLFSSFASFSQAIHCRPRMCMIDYNYHNDLSANADMTTIKAIKPDILIDNTPGGYYHAGCIASEYTPLGIAVYSYIHGNYEAVDLSQNLAFIDAIAADGATGVFFDEVSNSPNTASKAYLTQIHDRCVAKGLKLIFNPGTPTFDAWLMDHCDYLMSDEHYNGNRLPGPSEAPFHDRILVVNEGVTDADSAKVVSLGARRNGFGYSYACQEYIHLPTWVGAYSTAITQAPAAPVVTQTAGILHSDAPYGNQWYNATGVIAGATGTAYTATAAGVYHDIVTLDGCGSISSNTVTIATTGINEVQVQNVSIAPNPTTNVIVISTGNKIVDLNIYGIDGRLIKSIKRCTNGMVIDVSDIANGVYITHITDDKTTTALRLVVSR